MQSKNKYLTFLIKCLIKENISNLFKPMADQSTEICDNCLKSFPESKIATHFGYCRRNIKKCPQCGQMYDINSQEQHEEEFHKMAACKYCKKQLKPVDMSKHQQNCQYRTKYCEYCDLDVPMKDYPLHLRDCEARTKQCDKCRKPIANKDYLIHQISCPGFIQEPKPSISSTVQYQDYNGYLRQQKKKEQINTNQYKPSYPIYQQPRREGSRAREYRPQQAYTNVSNNIYSSNNGLRQAEIKKQTLIPNKPITNNSKPSNNYADIKMNKNAINYGDQRIPASNVYEKEIKGKVQINSNKNIGSNRNIGSGKIIQNKYQPTVVPQTKTYEYKPTVNTYGTNKDVPKNVYPSSNTRTYQQPQMDLNHKPIHNAPLNNYQKVQEPYKKQIPSSKDINYNRRQEKPQKPTYRKEQYQPRRQEPRREELRRYNQPQRTIPKTNPVPVQQYNSYQPSQYVAQQPAYQTPGLNDHEMDEELQQAIMASLGNLAISSPKQPSYKPATQSYKIDEIPPELLEKDMMNESFYGKQEALWEEFEKNKKRR